MKKSIVITIIGIIVIISLVNVAIWSYNNKKTLKSVEEVSSISSGDVLGAMTVVNIKPFNTKKYSAGTMTQLGPQNIIIDLKDPIEVTGEYEVVHSEIGFDGYCMSVSEATSLARLPAIDNETRNHFCFRDEEMVKQKLGEKNQTVTVIIDNYQINSYPTEVVDWADLVSVIKK